MGVILLVRHGQASFGTDDYDVLSEAGWTQSRQLGAWLAQRGIVPDAVIHGGMRRHRETAEGLVAATDWDVPLEVDPRWDEFDHLAVVAAYPTLSATPPSAAMHGDGADRRAFQELFEQATARWTSGHHDEGYAESFVAFTARVHDALAEAGRRAGPGATVVVVTSGGPVAAACAMLVDVGHESRQLAAPWNRFNTTIVNSSVTRVVVGSTGARLLTFNEHPHVEGDLLTYR